MSSAGGTSASSTLLAHIPAEGRTRFFSSLVRSLRIDDISSVHFAAALVTQQSDKSSIAELVGFLHRNVVDGNTQCPISICLEYPVLREKLFEKAEELLEEARSQKDSHSDEEVLSYLRFCCSTLFEPPVSHAQGFVFLLCLDMMNDDGPEKICQAARDVVFATFTTSDPCVREEIVNLSGAEIWQKIEGLVWFSDRKMYALVGYSLWLRWLLTGPPCAGDLLTEEYWRLLLQGLRNGDSEQRKMCLGILRISISADWSLASPAVREQYERYCTVFETIVLGRYINQVLECEGDLNLLASSNSKVEPKWFYTLLGSALENRMQDSNRKFIGNWVLDSELDPTGDFLEYFKNDLLPWATQGHLFVSSLKIRDGNIRCLHGDKLTAFLSRMLSYAAEPTKVQEMVASHILHGNPYMYAKVHLLEALDKAPETMKQTNLSRGVPEVIREYLSLRLPQLGLPDPKAAAPSKRDVLENDTLEKCRSFTPENGDIEDIWSDLEYLELPKSVLMIMPETIFTPPMIESSKDHQALRRRLAEMAHSLLQTASTKPFVFPRLTSTVRATTMTTPATLDALNTSKMIHSIATNPPALSTDILLEESIMHLTQHSYEHYFGERLSYGFAALLDFVSRLGSNQEVVVSLLRGLMQRWRDQKVPPPTVSSFKNTLQLQVLVLCCEQYQPGEKDGTRELVKDLHHILAIVSA